MADERYSGLPRLSHGQVGVHLAGKYRVDHVIGVGPVVIVGATQTVVDVPVIIELLGDDRVNDEDAVAEFIEEARARTQGSSVEATGPLPRVMDVEQLADGTPYLVIERSELACLDDYLEARGCTAWVQVVVDETIRACAALCPEVNVPEAVRPGDPTRIQGGVAGGGLAPAGDPAAEGEGDSLGAKVGALWVELYTQLAGKPPYEGKDGAELIAAVLTQAPPELAALRPDIDPRLASLVDAGVASGAPAERAPGLATPGGLAAALAPFASARAQKIADRLGAASSNGADAAAPPSAAAEGEPSEPPTSRPTRGQLDEPSTMPPDTPTGSSAWHRAVGLAVLLGAVVLVARWFGVGVDREGTGMEGAGGGQVAPSGSTDPGNGTAASATPSPSADPTTSARPPAAMPTESTTGPATPHPQPDTAPGPGPRPSRVTPPPAVVPPTPAATPGPTTDYGGRK